MNRARERSVDRVHQTLGIDPNDPGTTYSQTRYSVRQTSNGEDTAGNPLPVALLVTVAAGPPPRRLPAVALAVGLTLAATPWLVFNRSRPILASVALETPVDPARLAHRAVLRQAARAADAQSVGGRAARHPPRAARRPGLHGGRLGIPAVDPAGAGWDGRP